MFFVACTSPLRHGELFPWYVPQQQSCCSSSLDAFTHVNASEASARLVTTSRMQLVLDDVSFGRLMSSVQRYGDHPPPYIALTSGMEAIERK